MPKRDMFNWGELADTLGLGGVRDTARDVAGMVDYGYNKQRELRARYPLADAVVNFLPVVGTAVSADDTANSLSDGQNGQAAMNALGMLPGGKVLGGAIRQSGALTNATARFLVKSGYGHLVPDVVQGMEALGAVGLGGGAGAYAGNAINKQIEANKKNQ